MATTNLDHIISTILLRFVCACIFFVAGTAIAQQARMAIFEGEFDIPIELIGVNDGLSQGFTADMVIDQNGYIWIATNEGLNRYDGFDFKIFRHNPKDSTSISSNIVNYLFVDSSNKLWVSTNAGILDLFDPTTETFIHHSTRKGEKRGKPAVFVLPTSELANQEIIFPAFTGSIWNIALPALAESSKKARIVDLSLHFPILKTILRDSSSSHFLHAMRDGSIWAFGNDSIHYFSAEMLQKNLPPKAYLCKRKLDWRRMHDHCSVIIPDRNGGIYSIIGDSLLKFNFQRTEFDLFLRLPQPYSFNGSAFIDSKNRLWSATAKEAFLRIDLNTLQFQILRGRNENKTAVNAQNTFFGFEDKQQNIWLGTNGYGFLKISTRAEIFGSLPLSSKDQFALTKGYYRHRIVQPGKRAVFNDTLIEQWENLDPIELLESHGYQPQGQVTQLAVDAQGNYWVAATKPILNSSRERPTILKINPKTRLLTEMAEITNKSGLDWTPVPIIIDRENQIWFGNFDGEDTPNLHFLDQKQNKIFEYPIPAPPKPIGYPTISDWYETDDNQFWLATTIGLFSFSKTTKEWRSWLNDPLDTNSLSSNIVFSVRPDPRMPERFIWVGTSGGGLNCLDIKTNQFKHYTKINGLPNDVVYAIQFDKRNNLWISTNQGICLLNPITNNIQVFGELDGLLGNEFNRYQYSKSPDGKLCFGGINGTNYFDPEDFYHDQPPAKTILTSLKLANIELKYLPKSKKKGELSLSKPIEYTEVLTMKPDQFMITIGFSLLDLTLPSKNRFKYKLEGLSENWIDAGTNHEATFTNLSPGEYTFQVIGCSSYNVCSEEPAKLKLIVLAPWWATWWFRTIIILAALTMFYLLLRYRLQNLLRIEKLRNRIGQDLHDEIGSTLSSISLYSAVMQKTSDTLPPQTLSILDKIIDSTSQMMESMNDMVWTIKASNDSFIEVINRMRAFAVNMTEVQDILLTFDVDPAVEKMSLSMDLRKNIYLIYKEAINNAVKYGQCSQLNISFQKTGNRLRMRITDNGIGFDQDDPNQNRNLMGGNGIQGMKMRSKEMNAKLVISSENGGGTTIDLDLQL